MAQIVLGNIRDGRAICLAAGTRYDAASDVVIASYVGGEFAGGAVLCEFTDASCVGHLAGFKRHWLSRSFLWLIFDYTFRQCSFERLFCFVPEFNDRSLRLVEHLGFREVGRLRGAYSGPQDRIVLCAERSDCRFLRLKQPDLDVIRSA